MGNARGCLIVAWIAAAGCSAKQAPASAAGSGDGNSAKQAPTPAVACAADTDCELSCYAPGDCCGSCRCDHAWHRDELARAMFGLAERCRGVECPDKKCAMPDVVARCRDGGCVAE